MNVYWDIDNARLMTDTVTRRDLAGTVELGLNDTVPVVIFPVGFDYGAQVYSAASIPDGFSIYCALASSDLSKLYVDEDSFSPGSDDDYLGELDLEDSGLAADMPSSGSALDAVLEFTLVKTGEKRSTAQAAVRILPTISSIPEA
jgi:hypothetical protein